MAHGRHRNGCATDTQLINALSRTLATVMHFPGHKAGWMVASDYACGEGKTLREAMRRYNTRLRKGKGWH